MSYVHDHLPEHIDKVLRYARALTHRAAIAEDLAQEVCLRALAKEHLFKDADPPHLQAWLLCITYNTFTNWYRRERIRRAAPIPSELSDHRVQAPQEMAVQVRELFEMLKRIPKSQRDIIVAYALTSMDYGELGTRFDIPTGTVRSRIARARTELRQLRGE